MARVPMSERTRNELKEMFAGKRGADRSALVRQAARLIVEEALEAEAGQELGRGYYEHGAGSVVTADVLEISVVHRCFVIASPASHRRQRSQRSLSRAPYRY